MQSILSAAATGPRACRRGYEPRTRSTRTVKIELWPTDRPEPYPKNPRKIPDAAVRKVAASIRRARRRG